MDSIRKNFYEWHSKKLRKEYYGPVDLDNAIPMDIYELFEKVTGYDYGNSFPHDELLILNIAAAYEKENKND